MSAKKKLPWEDVWGPEALVVRREAIRDHQATLAKRRNEWIESNDYFYGKILRLLKFVIEPGRRVLSVRCETGKFLSGLSPATGVGIDVSEEIVAHARELHPRLTFQQHDPELGPFPGVFDEILVENTDNMSDVLAALHNLSGNCAAQTRMAILFNNRLWQPVFNVAELIGFKMPRLEPNWLSEHDLENLLFLAGFERVKTYRAMLAPKWIPLFSNLLNDLIATLPGVSAISQIRVMVARPVLPPIDPGDLTVSVIVPCKDEQGNIEAAVRRIPEMGKGTEIIFCDDKSTDGTADEVRRLQAAHPERNIRLIDGPGINKAENVWAGFNAATGDILMILDADLTVMPEELPMFFDAMASRKAEFVNGVRLVYPMKRGAMKYGNLLGNRMFSLLMSFVLGTKVRDTLCGTKVLWRRDWSRMSGLVGGWGIEDHWGDFDLLFSASKLNLKIVDVPTHYQERTHGVTKMSRVLSNGMRMASSLLVAYVRFIVRR